MALDRLSLTSFAQVGKARRLQRIFRGPARKTIIVPVDDSLIFGPRAGLEVIDSKLAEILSTPPDALLAFPGVFRHLSSQTSTVAGIVNLTASTSRSHHTRKVQVGTVQQAAQMGLDAVAVHVNISSTYEPEMLKTLGAIARDCESLGMPLLAIMYPRFESERGDDNYDDLKNTDRARYTELVAHSARVGVDLGADLIKTQYTGDPDSFHAVVTACRPVPLVVAGGPTMPDDAILRLAHDVIRAGGGGISFGRNVFSRESPHPLLAALKAIVHGGQDPDSALLTLRQESIGYKPERTA